MSLQGQLRVGTQGRGVIGTGNQKDQRQHPQAAAGDGRAVHTLPSSQRFASLYSTVRSCAHHVLLKSLGARS